MKLFILLTSSLLYSGMTFAFGQTWDLCEGNGARFSSKWHDSYETQISANVVLKNGESNLDVNLQTTKSYGNGLITYTSTIVNVTIDERTCVPYESYQKCDGELSFVNPQKKVPVTCLVEIPYTPATGSGGRCGGRRCRN